MHVRVNRDALVKPLSLIRQIQGKDPIISYALIRAEGATLKMAATDLAIDLVADIPCEVKGEGTVAIDAKWLQSAVYGLPKKKLTLRSDDQRTCKISVGKTRCQFSATQVIRFPKVASMDGIVSYEMEAHPLRDMIDGTLFSASSDPSRPHIRTVLFEFDATSARMVATDGHRLAKAEHKVGKPPPTDGAVVTPINGEVLIPKEGAVVMRRLLEDASSAHIAVQKPLLFVRVDGVTIAIKLMQGPFVPYQGSIPKQCTTSVLVNREILLDAIARAQYLLPERLGCMLSIDPAGITLHSEAPNLGSLEERIDIQRHEGRAIRVRFNPQYVHALLSRMQDSEVAIELNNPLDPTLFRPANDKTYMGVVMPMRPDV